MNIICLKLTTGEDLIAKIENNVELLNEELRVSNKSSGYLLSDVHIINLVQVAPNQVGMNLIPYFIGNPESKVTIDSNHVIATYKPNDDIKDGFVQKTSPIEIVKSMPQTRIQLG